MHSDADRDIDADLDISYHSPTSRATFALDLEVTNHEHTDWFSTHQENDNVVENANATPRKRIWQYAFVLGIVAGIVAAILVFGMSTFTTVLTVFGIVVGLFNAFLGSSGNASDGNWFLSRIKHTLDVSNFLKVATVVVWLGAIGVVTYGVLDYYHQAQKVTLSGRILTAGGEPAGSALVILQLKNKKEVVTSADGTFTFANLDLSNEPSKRVSIQVQWKDLIKEESVDLAIDRERTIKLPPGAPPFRVSYITLEGPAIDLLLRGQIDKRWEERLGGQPFIIPNSVSNTLNFLTKNFSTRMEEYEAGGEFSMEAESGPKSDEGPRIAAKLIGKPSFVGSDGETLHASISQNIITSLTAQNEGWNVEVGEVGDWDPVESLMFWRFAKREDLERDNFREGFDKYITKHSMPADFCLVTLQVGGCGEGAKSTELQLVPRMLKLRVAVLENILSEPIRMGKFLVRETKVETLRSREEEDSTLKSLNPEEQSLFPPETLGPGEKLLVPLEMVMTYDKDNNISVQAFTNPPSNDERAKVTSKLATLATVPIPFGEEGQTFDIKTDLLLAMLKKPKQSPMLDKEYIFGPSASIESVTVNNVSYPFRQNDVTRLAIRRGGAEIGSCPFIFTYSAQSRSWESEGHILYRVNSPLLEATDEKELKRFDGRVIVKEQDPETSFIDFMYVKATALDGSETLLYPQNQTLRSQDRVYLKLRKGEQLEVKFDFPLNFLATYTLVARGYYVPFRKAENRRYPPLP